MAIVVSSPILYIPALSGLVTKYPLLIIRKSYDKIKKVLYDFWDAGSAAQLIISRMISSLVCRIPSLPRRPMPLMVVSMSFITMPSPPLNS